MPIFRLRRLGLVSLCVCALACRPRPAAVCVPPAVPPPLPAAATPAPPPPPPPSPVPSAPLADSTEPSDAERYLPGEARSSEALAARSTAVLLFAPPSPPPSSNGLEQIEALRFQPVVCAAAGKLYSGARCGELMPPRVRVRLTDAGDRGLETIELSRSTAPFKDTAGQQTYPAPYGPACCMYNTCVGKTVPYFPIPGDRGSAWLTTRTILAVWPADADIKLTPFTPDTMGDAELSDAPSLKALLTAATPGKSQAVRLGRFNYLTTVGGKSGPGGHLLIESAQGPRELLRQMGVRAYFLLSSSDLNGDGKGELLVYARWANDYSVHVLREGEDEPLYGFSCGNI